MPEPGNPQALNRYAYVYNNPLRYTDPSGHDPCGGPGVYVPDCGVDGWIGPKGNRQYDLTGYLAQAMTTHGRDPRVQSIARGIQGSPSVYPSLGGDAGMAYLGLRIGSSVAAYAQFNELEATNKVWDIKQRIKAELGSGIVLCGEVCNWYDYSVPGNIHFGYVAGRAGIDPGIAAIAGGILEQQDSLQQGQGLHLVVCKVNFTTN